MSILSLNQLAENLAKAEALGDVIASVFNGLRDVEVTQTAGPRIGPGVGANPRRANKDAMLIPQSVFEL